MRSLSRGWKSDNCGTNHICKTPGNTTTNNNTARSRLQPKVNERLDYALLVSELANGTATPRDKAGSETARAAVLERSLLARERELEGLQASFQVSRGLRGGDHVCGRGRERTQTEAGMLLARTRFSISRADRQTYLFPTPLMRTQMEREQSAQRAQQAALEQADALAQERREVEATRGLLLHAHQRIEALEAEVQGLQAEREAAHKDRERALEEAAGRQAAAVRAVQAQLESARAELEQARGRAEAAAAQHAAELDRLRLQAKDAEVGARGCGERGGGILVRQHRAS